MIDFYVSNDDGVTFRRALLPSGVKVGIMQPQQFIEDDNGVIWILGSLWTVILTLMRPSSAP